MAVPKDPVILLSYLSTQLRDFYPSLTELCRSLDLDQAEIEAKMELLDYHYDEGQNRFC